MRKIPTLVCCVLLITCFIQSGLAEKEFTLRNGILFGDTMDDILKKETSLTRLSETSNTFKGRVAGYNDTECIFFFDSNQKLISMDYSFANNICTTRESTNDVYKKLYQSLSRQYGKPKGNTGGTTYIITGPAIDRMGIWVYLLGALDKNSGDYYDYDEWIVDTDSYHVKIDLISYYYRNQDFEYFYFVDLSYHQFTDDDLQAAIDNKLDEQNEVDNDL